MGLTIKVQKPPELLRLPAAVVMIFCAVTLAACGGSDETSPPVAGTHSVDLSWGASPSSIDGYHVYRSSQQGGPYQPITPGLVRGLTFTDSNVQSGQTFFYVVTSVDSRGIESIFSNEAAAVIPSP